MLNKTEKINLFMTIYFIAFKLDTIEFNSTMLVHVKLRTFFVGSFGVWPLISSANFVLRLPLFQKVLLRVTILSSGTEMSQ